MYNPRYSIKQDRAKDIYDSRDAKRREDFLRDEGGYVSSKLEGLPAAEQEELRKLLPVPDQVTPVPLRQDTKKLAQCFSEKYFDPLGEVQS